MNNEQLKKVYFEVLQKHAAESKIAPENDKDFWAEKLDPEKKKEEPKKFSGLSGLFLTSVSKNYEKSRTKIMLVGAETAGWDPLLERNESGQALTTNGKQNRLKYESLEDYIDKTMFRHSQVFSNGLAAKNSKGKTFYNYLRELDKELSQIGAGYDSGGWVWCNLHCFDWNKKSPVQTECYEKFINPLSSMLLYRQVEILKPKFIIFLSKESDRKRHRQFFDCFEGGITSIKNEGSDLNNKYLKQFLINHDIHCIRTYHPAYRLPDAQITLIKSQKLLRNLIEQRI